MDNGIIVLLGATGDLASKKLFPALYSLFSQQKLKKTLIVGAALDDSMPALVLGRVKSHIAQVDDAMWAQFCECVRYHAVDFCNAESFVALEKFVTSLERQFGLSGNRLVYIAAPSDFFCQITKHCITSGLVQKNFTRDVMHRMVYEKPFGRDLASAHEINNCIQGSLHESQVYRIDHYLTKEIVSNIAMIRFSNIVFEPLWNNKFVESVEIVLSEEVGVEGRGAYYDRYGALRDVVQNHALELVALIAMESPENLVGDAVRERRAAVLKNVQVVDGLQGQYDGYQQEVGVAKNSITETFAALVLNVNNERWAGVPFYITTGKRLIKKETKVVVRFKNVDCLLTKGCPMESNHLTIQIAPTASFTLSLNAKKIGSVDELEPIKMDYCHSCQFGAAQPEDYGAVFAQVMAGETAISVRFDEIESAWRVIDMAYAENFPLYRYQQGSTGPDGCRALAQKYKIRG